jgi:hypothetical protein
VLSEVPLQFVIVGGLDAPKYVCNSVGLFAESLAATATKAKIDVALAVVYMLAPL